MRPRESFIYGIFGVFLVCFIVCVSPGDAATFQEKPGVPNESPRPAALPEKKGGSGEHGEAIWGSERDEPYNHLDDTEEFWEEKPQTPDEPDLHPEIFEEPAGLRKNGHFDFSGEWDWAESPEDRSFYLELMQDGKNVTGSYCATAFYGARVDCGFEEGACRIHGTVYGDTARVEFISCFGKKRSRARLRHYGERIEWKITEIPEGQWYFAPQHAALRRAIKIWKSGR